MTMPAMTVDVSAPFDAVAERLPAALKEEGFGVLTEIDVEKTLRDKIGVEFGPYRIYGACNPKLAHQTLQEDAGVGVLLPCNVVLQSVSPEVTRVYAVDPAAAIGAFGNEAMRKTAGEVKERLERVLASLA